ncbi:MAG: hypothetical protein RLZZ236_1897, partial [Bacteroidota bacterium]
NRVRDSSEKPTAKQGLVANSPTWREVTKQTGNAQEISRNGWL